MSTDMSIGDGNPAIVGIRSALASERSKIATALGGLGENEVNRYLSMTIRAIEKGLAKVNLAQVNVTSLVNGIKDAAFHRLVPGEDIYFVPFRDKQGNSININTIISYKGLMTLWSRNNHGLSIQPYPVYEGDDFRVVYGLNPDIIHIPSLNRQATEKKNLTHVYVVIDFGGGRKEFHLIDKADIEEAKRLSPNHGESSFWERWPLQMAFKTAIRRALKYRIGDMNTELARSAFEGNEEYAKREPIDVDDAEPAITHQPQQDEPKKRGRRSRHMIALEQSRNSEGEEGSD